MNNAANFYGNLFTIQITIFGIFIASIFVIVQLVYSSFSSEPLKFIFQSWVFRSYVVFATISVLASVVPYCVLSIQDFETSPVEAIVENRWFILAATLLFFVPVFLFVRLMYESIGFLRPSKVIEHFQRTFDLGNLKKFLRKKYGINEPKEPYVHKIVIPSMDASDGNSTIVNSNYVGDVRKAKDQFESNRRFADLTKQNSADSVDPFSFIGDVAMNAIKRADFRTLSQVGDLFLEISQKSWVEFERVRDLASWSPDKDLASNYVRHVIDWCETIREVSRKEGFNTAEITAINTSYRILDELFPDTTPGQRSLFYNYWKRVADDSINRTPVVFKSAVRFIRLSGEREFDTYSEEALNNIFRILGWLGERLLTNSELKERELMLESESSNEYDELYEALHQFSYRYNEEQPTKYPLILFDAIMVVFRKLIQQYNRNETQYLKEQLQSFIYAIESFGLKAIENNNLDGAELAAVRLAEQYDKLKSAGVNEMSEEVIRSLLDLALDSAGHPKIDKSKSILREDLHSWILNKIQKMNVNNIVIRHLQGKPPKYSPHFDYDAYWTFFKEIGRRVGSDFGFMFDPDTGDSYPPDDPRRG